MWQSVEVLNFFSILTFKQIFWETETFFKKLEYHFLVENTKIENALFPYKVAISETNVKTNRMVSANGPITKNEILTLCYFLFLTLCYFLFQLNISHKELIWCTNDPNFYICTFCKCWSFIWQCFFPVSILKHFRIDSEQKSLIWRVGRGLRGCLNEGRVYPAWIHKRIWKNSFINERYI